jgi:hypothetical protein
VTGGGCGGSNEKCEGSWAAAYICAGVMLGGGSLESSIGLIGLVNWWTDAMFGGGSFEPSIGLMGLMTDGPVNEKWEGS